MTGTYSEFQRAVEQAASRCARLRVGCFALVASLGSPGCGLVRFVDPCAQGGCSAASDAAVDASSSASPSASMILDSAVDASAAVSSMGPSSASSAPSASEPDSGDAALDASADAAGECEGACSGEQPYCDARSGECVECVYAGDTAVTTDAAFGGVDLGCGAAAARCTAQGACVECLSDADCAAGVCDTAANTCAPCLPDGSDVDPGCGEEAPRCYVGGAQSADGGPDAALSDAGGSTAAECVACLTDTDCGGDTSLCDQATHACVACLTSDDCLDPAAARCDPPTRSCMGCEPEVHAVDGVNPDCAHLGGNDVCHAGSCVTCNSEFAGACGGTVCDVRPGAASEFSCDAATQAGSTSACGECINDTQCQPGQGCVLTTFGSGEAQEPAGYHCLYRLEERSSLPETYDSTTDRDALGVWDCQSQAQPYVTQVATTSLGGEAAEYCAPRAATCLALNQYSETPCGEPEPAEVDAGSAASEWVAECGEVGLEDAVCQDFGAVLKRCSPRCLTDDDCVILGGQFACVASGGKGYCAF